MDKKKLRSAVEGFARIFGSNGKDGTPSLAYKTQSYEIAKEIEAAKTSDLVNQWKSLVQRMLFGTQDRRDVFTFHVICLELATPKRKAAVKAVEKWHHKAQADFDAFTEHRGHVGQVGRNKQNKQKGSVGVS